MIMQDAVDYISEQLGYGTTPTIYLLAQIGKTYSQWLARVSMSSEQYRKSRENVTMKPSGKKTN